MANGPNEGNSTAPNSEGFSGDDNSWNYDAEADQDCKH